jgi:NitT/TauT family transport system substrate-binding protein
MNTGPLLAAIAAAFAFTTVAAEPVKIVNIGHGYYAGALYVAKQEKLFEKYGLEPEITLVQGGPLALQTVLTKQADVGVVSYEHVLSAAVQGKRIVSIYNVANRPLNNVIVDAATAAGAENLGLEEKIKRLKGKRVGLPSANGSGEKMLKFLAGRYGLQLPGDINTVYLGSEPASYVAAFQRKVIDAAVPVEPAGVMVQQAGQGTIYVNVMNGDVPEFRDLIFMTLAVHPDTMRDKPELLRKVAQVFSEANRILRDPARGKALMGKEYPEMNAEANDQVYAAVRQIWPESGRMSDAQARAAIDYLQPTGPSKVDVPMTFTNEFLPK